MGYLHTKTGAMLTDFCDVAIEQQRLFTDADTESSYVNQATHIYSTNPALTTILVEINHRGNAEYFAQQKLGTRLGNEKPAIFVVLYNTVGGCTENLIRACK